MNQEKKLWGGRFSDQTDSRMFNLSKSTQFDWRLALIDVLQTSVHVKGLHKSGLVSDQEKDIIISNLSEIYKDIDQDKIQPDERDEDVHTVIERVLENRIGKVAGKIRAGRSRNDQIVTDLKIFLRLSAREISSEILELIKELNNQAMDNLDQLSPGFTHLQHAQPVSLGHEINKHSFSLLRDIQRFTDWDKRIDQSPLGSAALAGTSLISDPLWIAKQLGFSQTSDNSIDAVSDRDFVAEYLFICAMTSIHLSKLAEEIILMSTSEFNYLTLDDSFSTGSSIMPQKKNPDAAELARGKTGRFIGNLNSLLITLKALPFAYNRDLQEDKEVVFDSHDNLILILKAFTGMISTMKFNKNRLKESAIKSHSLATEVADYLVRKNIAFADAHEISGNCVKLAETLNKEVHELSINEFKSINSIFDKDILNYLNPTQSLKSRNNFMGTAPDNVENQVKRIQQQMAVFTTWSAKNPLLGLKI